VATETGYPGSFQKMDLEKKAIERIRMASEMSLHHYGKPLICTYSGGKDSDVMLELFKRSGIPFEVHNSHTTADAPQTVRHIKNVFRKLEQTGVKVNIEYPIFKGERTSMWDLIQKKLVPPTRMVRYCCSILKETGCKNRYIATGVRWDESAKRTSRQEFEKLGITKADSEHFTSIMLNNDNDISRRMTELCTQKNKMVVNPIIDWKHSDIWEYIYSEHVKTCELYKCGYERVGCIGCPLAQRKKRLKEFHDFPQYQKLYTHAFERMLRERESRGLENLAWSTGEEVFLWWIEDNNIPGQIEMDLIH
jgi:phosphoadenosine phosphosulfate reductase